MPPTRADFAPRACKSAQISSASSREGYVIIPIYYYVETRVVGLKERESESERLWRGSAEEGNEEMSGWNKTGGRREVP